MKRSRVVIALLLVLIAVFPFGCRWIWLAKIDHAVKPVIKGVEAYRVRTGHLPANMDDFSSDLEGVRLKDSSNVGLILNIGYRTNSENAYVVSFNHVHYDVDYPNGKRAEVWFNPFR